MRTVLYHIFAIQLEDTRKAGKLVKKLVYPVDDYGLHYDEAMKLRNEWQKDSNDILIVDTL